MCKVYMVIHEAWLICLQSLAGGVVNGLRLGCFAIRSTEWHLAIALSNVLVAPGELGAFEKVGNKSQRALSILTAYVDGRNGRSGRAEEEAEERKAPTRDIGRLYTLILLGL